MTEEHFMYWMRCEVGVTLEIAWDKIEPYFIRRPTKLIYNDVTLCYQLQANEIKSLEGTGLNRFQVHESLLALVQDNLYYDPHHQPTLITLTS